MTWKATRESALERFHTFLPSAGSSYAAGRNYVFQPPTAQAVSGLSPYITRRILTEEEVFSAVVKTHGFHPASKFLQEVAWRTYWKGWLYLRPDVWTRYRSDLDTLRSEDTPQPWVTAYTQALDGDTGIDCFDCWARELTDTGYLHNHTRMWFASIWVFTLRLPWQLGADFFYQHLLDADAASNTLSWRWVAGLHTPGKHYVATAENIQRYTQGRFNPAGLLNEKPEPLAGSPPAPCRPFAPPAGITQTNPSHSIWLVTQEDLHGDNLVTYPPEGARMALLQPDPDEPTSCRVQRFEEAAAADLSERVNDLHPNLTLETFPLSKDTALTLRSENIHEVHVMDPGIGYRSDFLNSLSDTLSAHQITLVRHMRDWDRQLYPHATKGYFHFRKQLPSLASTYLD